MKIYSKTITEVYYENSMGEEKPMRELDHNHLLNAYAKASREGLDVEQKYLCDELRRRLAEKAR